MENINEKIIVKLEYFRLQIMKHYKTLNRGAMLLFIATLACWSVNHPIIRLVAAFVVLFIFASVVFESRKDDRNFDKFVKDIEKEIENSDLGVDIKKARRYDLSDIEAENNYKRLFIGPRFLVCYIFWFVTLFFFIQKF
ncbi:MAG: hypothetical protein GY714_07545 [Desulfobacterales bacterium]|nr:hypothetical protein [Desulfobacterales bacterium]MCP4161377.1 hypothetical protein [Deltaproteobacteria bacterium]